MTRVELVAKTTGVGKYEELNSEEIVSAMSFNGTLRSWLTLLNVRCDSHSQKECRLIATRIGELLEEELPNVFTTINWRTGMFM